MKQSLLPLYFLLFILPAFTFAMSPEDKGLSIATEWKKRDIGWVDYKAKVKMILRNKQGEESIRDFRYITMEMTKGKKRVDGDKVLVMFDQPEDVKGTTLLTYSHFDRDDDQWLYLPAIKRTKRISSHNKSGSFVGSEFAYEDITFQEVEKYTYKWEKEEMYNGMLCDVVVRHPVDKENTGYLFQRVWYDKEFVRIHKIDYYDRKQSLLKTQSFDTYKKYLGHIWRADNELMVNHQTGKATQLVWSDYKFHVNLTESQFNNKALERLR